MVCVIRYNKFVNIPLLSSNDHTPIYNIKAVAYQLGLLPVTLRAWERRYGIPQPKRGNQGYRMYSEHDVRTLRWIKNQMETGLSIGRVVEYLNELRRQGYDPVNDGMTPSIQNISLQQPITQDFFVQQLMNALLNFDDISADQVLRQAFGLYTLDQTLVGVIQPVLVEMGDRWHRGELPIAVEHFATQFCMQHLMNMLVTSNSPTRSGLIVAASAPGETHQIGILMIVVMLRWRGWDVKYLGPDLKLDRLVEAIAPMHPRLLMFTATRRETALNLMTLPDALKELAYPPKILVGGQGIHALAVDGSFAPGIIHLEGLPTEMVAKIESLMETG